MLSRKQWRCWNRGCKKRSNFFPANSPLAHMKASFAVRVRILYHFLFNSGPGAVFKKFGGEKHSPVSYRTIAKYLLLLRHVVAAENIERLKTVFFTGPQEWDETWLRCRRKHNRGRYTERKFAMVRDFFVKNTFKRQVAAHMFFR